MAEERLEFSDNALCRRYFAKFDRIYGHLRAITAGEAPLGAERLGELEAYVIERYLSGLARTFQALSHKYLLTGLVQQRLPSNLEIDQTDSGFPVFREIIALKDDRERAGARLGTAEGRAALKSGMVDHVLKFKTLPRDLQFAMSQQVYFESLAEGDPFLPQNGPELLPIGKTSRGLPLRLAHWAVYDTSRNLPNIYLMALEDAEEPPLDANPELWRRISEHLLAQSLSTLKLVTIATGFDQDFPRLHPKLLKRVHVGPMYSGRFTRHSDTVQQILDEVAEEVGQDWVFAWTVETILSKGGRKSRSGLFGETLKQVFDLDIYDAEASEAGASAVHRYMVLPYRAFQALAERAVPQLDPVHKYVVGTDGQILSHA